MDGLVDATNSKPCDPRGRFIAWHRRRPESEFDAYRKSYLESFEEEAKRQRERNQLDAVVPVTRSNLDGADVVAGELAPHADGQSAREKLHYKPTTPYVHVWCGSLGWVMEVVDPTLPAGRQVVSSDRPLKKPTPEMKRRALNAYIHSRKAAAP